MTDSPSCALRCGAVVLSCPAPGQQGACRMGSEAAEKAALAGCRPARSAWARIGGGNGPGFPRTRFVICYLLSVSLGKKPADAAARRSAGWQVAGLRAERPGGAVQFRRGGRGSRPRCARSSYIHPAKEKIFPLPASL